MTSINRNIDLFSSAISYVISRIMLWTVLGLLISGLVLSIIAGIILIVMLPIISTLIIIGLIISLIQIMENSIMIKTMTGKSKRNLFFQRVEAGVNP